MKQPHHTAHVGLEVEHFPVNRRLIRKGEQWVLGTVIECPEEGCRWALGLAKEFLQVLGDAASEHLEDEQRKHKALCQEIWRCYNEATETPLMAPSCHDPVPLYAQPIVPTCGCGKPAQEQPEEQ